MAVNISNKFTQYVLWMWRFDPANIPLSIYSCLNRKYTFYSIAYAIFLIFRCIWLYTYMVKYPKILQSVQRSL